MGETKEVVKIRFERGRVGNGWLTQTEVFLLSSKREKKLRPSSVEKNNRTNQGREDYTLSVGRKYHIVTRRIKKGRVSCGSAILAIEKSGEIHIKKWQGDFPPQFSLIQEVIKTSFFF